MHAALADAAAGGQRPEQGLISAEDLYDNMRFAKLAGDKIAKMAVLGKPPL